MVSTANNENVRLSGRECISLSILNSTDVEGSLVLFNMHQLPDTPTIMSFRDHGHSSNFKLENIAHLVRGNVNFDTIIRCNIGVGITQSTPIVCHSYGNLVRSNIGLLDLAQLKLLLLLRDSVQNKSSFRVKQQPKHIVTLFKLEDVHESSREVMVSPNLSVHFHTPFHTDLHALLVCEVQQKVWGPRRHPSFRGSSGWAH